MITADNLVATTVTTNTLVVNGPYNTIYNGCYQFIRDDITTPMVGMRFFIKNAPDKNTDGTEHYYGWLPDWANFGGYMAFYDSKLDKDIMQIGVHGAQAGKFAIGVDLINPDVQLQIHDFPDVSWSVSTWSAKNGIQLRSKSKYAYLYQITREDTFEGHFQNFSQGNLTHDWSCGFEVGSYDFVFMNPNGEHPASPDNPGQVRFRIKGNGEISSPTIDALKARIAALEKVILQKQQTQTPTSNDTRI